MTKNWLIEVPSTDEEVAECLQSIHKKNNFYASSMLGIYRIYRKRGCTVLDAYEEALRAALSNTLQEMGK